MADFLAGFDVFIHPSCHAPDGDHEATPVILLEAQATGLPVIATDHFDLPLEVIHGRTGLLAPENDPVALAGHIRRFYWMENAEYQMFSHNARQHVEAGFDVKVGKFPLSASGKASAAGHPEGFIKVIFDAKYGEFLGCHMIGMNVTEMIAEAVVARKLETTAHEILNAVHPHPTMSEGVKEATAAAYGEAIDI